MEIEASEAIKIHKDPQDAEQEHAEDSKIVSALRPTIFNHLLLSSYPLLKRKRTSASAKKRSQSLLQAARPLHVP